MTHIRKLALGLFLALLSTSYSNAQDSITGNLIVNGTFSNGTTGWTSAGDGYAGLFPAGGVTGYQYSWQGGTVSQSIAVSQALSGTGIVVKGLQYGWQYANWCRNQIGGQQSCFDPDGPVDPFSANVSLTNSAGTSVYSRSFQYNTWLYAWQWENQDVTFATPYSTKNLGNLSISFSGQDAGYWAGYYGPVVTNVYAKLKYGVDPCVDNPLYSPTCPGYLDALNKLVPVSTTTTATASVDTVSTTGVVAATASPPPEDPPPTGSPPPPPGSPPPQDGSPPPPGTQSPGTQSPGTQTAGTPSSNTAPPPPPSSGGQPAKAGEPQTASSGGGSGGKSTVSTSQVLSMISSQQAKNADIANSVTAAAQAVATSAAVQATAQAESIAGAAATASATASQGSGLGFSSSQSSGSSVAMSNSSGNSIGINSARLSLTDTYSAVSDTSVAAVSYSLQQAGRQTSFEAEMPRTEGLRMNSGSPLDALLNPGLEAPSATMEQQFSTVKKNVQNNEAAGGVDIAVMAVQPQGYQAYSVAMPDTAFYAPREIYRNQVNVDNVRLLRGLGNDRLHQDLVNLQYK